MRIIQQYNDSHLTFLDLNNVIDKGKFIYKMFSKLDTCNFHIVRIPSITTNIPSIIFYSSTMSEFVIIARSTLSVLILENKDIQEGKEGKAQGSPVKVHNYEFSPLIFSNLGHFEFYMFPNKHVALNILTKNNVFYF